jgi:multidrug efflux pump subunit AcrA (membrane-fusion protein)
MTTAPATSRVGVANRRRRAPLLAGILAILVVVASYHLGWQHFADHRGITTPQPPPPVPVVAATVQEQNFPIVLTGIGYVTALNSATVRSMVTEPIISIDFKDGQYVKKGQLLAQLYPNTYQAQLDEAEANLARDQAHLENGRINLGRYIPLENRVLHHNSRSPPSKQRTRRSRRRYRPIRRRSNMPKPS